MRKADFKAALRTAGCLFLLGGPGGVWASDEYRWNRELQEAIAAGNERAAVLAVDLGAAPSGKDFSFAVEAGWIGLAEALLDRGLFAGGKDARAALLHAVRNGDRDMVWMLLDRGADSAPTPDRGTSVLETAVEHARVDIALLLIDQGTDLAHGNHHALRMAARRGQAAIALRIIQEGVPIDDRSYQRLPVNRQSSALMEAAREGQSAMVELLLGRGADPTLTDARGKTAYQLAQANARWHPERPGYAIILERLRPGRGGSR